MKCILSDFRRAIAGRWFLAALIATIITIYLSVGRATYGLIGYLENIEMYDDSFWYSMSDLLALGMKGNFGMLTLPALSALPFAAQALHEIKKRSHPLSGVPDGKKELDHRQGCGLRYQRDAAARGGGGAAVSNPERTHVWYRRARVSLG